MGVEPVPPHSELQVYVGDANVVVQPLVKQRGVTQVDTLSVDLRTGSVQRLDSAPQRGPAVSVVAVLGAQRLYKGYALVVATEAAVVANVLGADIYQIKSTKLITSEEARLSKENKPLLRLLSDGADPEGSGRAMYFSYYYDITLCSQRIADVANDTSTAMKFSANRADKDFFWNFAMSRSMIDAGAHRFVMPCIMGFVRQVPNLVLRQVKGARAHRTATLTLIARRCVQRAGTRHWRRGADTSGYVANYVETEQLLQLEPEEGTDVPTVASYLVLRGSIPIMWTELPNIKYKPTRVIAPSDTLGPTLAKHMEVLRTNHKEVTAINLVNQHGGEGKLCDAFKFAVDQYNSGGGKGLHYVAFDFHQECGTKRYERMSILWDQIKDDFARHSFFLHGANGTLSRQRGAMRVNCIDCLDRTNVVQGVLGRKSLDAILSQLGLLAEGVPMSDTYPDVEQEFKVLWADHGDAVSMQYAGTGAMKSGFTRTGKRTYGGLLDDGFKSVSRYYLNNFQDGKKQDAVDLITGAYAPEPGTSMPKSARRSPLIPLLMAVVLIYFGFLNIARADLSRQSLLLDVIPSVLGPILVGLAVLYFTAANGKYLVNRPVLCYELAATVTKPKKS